METVIHTVTVKLTKEQINHKAHRLAETLTGKSEIIAEKKSSMAFFKAAIDAKDELIGKLSNEITTGEVTEDVKCLVRMNYDAGLKEYIHEGEVVGSEPLSAEERQLTITG